MEQKPKLPPNEEHKDTEGLSEQDKQNNCTWLSLLRSLGSPWRLPWSLGAWAASRAPDVTVERQGGPGDGSLVVVFGPSPGRRGRGLAAPCLSFLSRLCLDWPFPEEGLDPSPWAFRSR